MRPDVVTTDMAACYPPALERALPEAEHLTGKLAQQRIERDHGHLKRRPRRVRWFKADRTAGLFCRAHGSVRNRQDGFSEWGWVPGDPRMPQAPCLILAWEELTQELQAA